MSKIAKFWLSRSKIIWIFLNFFSLKNIILGAHFLLLTFLENFNFQTTLFSKMTSNFWRHLLNWTQDLKNFLRAWLLVLGLKEYLVACAIVCIKSEVILMSTMCLRRCLYYHLPQVNWQCAFWNKRPENNLLNNRKWKVVHFE